MKQITLTAPRDLLSTLGEVIINYADAAYPVGGSECAQAARIGLLNCAEKIKIEFEQQSNSVQISRRIKGHVKAAIQYDAQLMDENDAITEAQALARTNMLLDCLNGKVIRDENWLELDESIK